MAPRSRLGLRTEQGEVCFIGDAVRPLVVRGEPRRDAPDEVAVAEADERRRQAVGTAELFPERNRRGEPASTPPIEVPDLRARARQPREGDRLERRPGADDHPAERRRSAIRLPTHVLTSGPRTRAGSRRARDRPDRGSGSRRAGAGRSCSLSPMGQRLLGKRSRFTEPPGLAEVFGSVDGHEPEPAGVGDRAGHGLRFSQVRQHLLELAERVRATRGARGARRSLAPRLSDVSGRWRRACSASSSEAQRLAMRRPRLGLDRRPSQICRGLAAHACPRPKWYATSSTTSSRLLANSVLQTEPGRRVVTSSSALQHAAVDDVLGQRVLEAVHQLGLLRRSGRRSRGHGARCRCPATCAGAELRGRERPAKLEPSSHHRRPWSVCLSVSRGGRYGPR